MLSVGLLLLSLWASSSLAQDNDWSKPCLNGVCFYDLPPSADGAGAVGTLKIWGSSDAITDVTRAAGWEILDCNTDALTQRIRLVCTGDAKCDHLFKGRRGPRGKVVRLPESCGKNAFAHIKAARPSPDQRIPASVASRIIRRDGIEPEVEELEIDTDFATGATEIQEPVYFSLVGSNTQAVAEEDVTKDLGDLEPRWKVDKSHTFPLFSYHKPFVLVDQSLTCSAGDASLNGNLKISGTLDADVTVTVGVYAKGSIFPPDIDQFKAYAVLNGAVSGAIDLSASLSGSYSTGRVTLVEAAIAGINFAGILTIGPTVGVAASVDASFGLAANVRAGFNWQLVQAQLYLPASSSPNGQAFQIGTAPLELTITPTASATASIEAHIIPIVALKLKALGIVEAQVYVDLDASARAVADVSVSATGIITIPSKFPSLAIREPLAAGLLPLPSNRPLVTGILSPAPGTVLPIRGGNAIGGLDTTVVIEQRAEAETEAERAAWSYTYGGCLDVDAGIDINLGANAKFFGFFEKGKVFDIYTKNWDLYYGCFGDRKSTAAARRDNWARSINGSSMGALERRLSCSANNNNAAPVTVISTTTSGSAAVPK